MDQMRAYRFRIYPDEKRQYEIDLRLVLAKNLYNKLLEKTREEFKKDKGFKINKSNLNRLMGQIVIDNKEYLKLYSQTRQNVFSRLEKAYANFFSRVKAKKRGVKLSVGFPRFKSSDRYKSITYPQDNGSFSIEDNRLRIARIGTMKIELHRNIKGDIKNLVIKKEGEEYYAIFTTKNAAMMSEIKNTNPIGIDMGLETFATLSNGTKIQKSNFNRIGERRIAKWQRIVSRKKKGSKNRDKAKIRLRKEWQKLDNRNNDYLHKITSQLVEAGYTSFAVEKLSIQKMLKNHTLSKSIQSASWGKFVRFLSYKAESAGMTFVRVDARNTSQICSNCNHINNTRMPLSERTFTCEVCGNFKDRDINAAINILKRATAGSAGSQASGGVTTVVQQESQVAPMKQEHILSDCINTIMIKGS